MAARPAPNVELYVLHILLGTGFRAAIPSVLRECRHNLDNCRASTTPGSGLNPKRTWQSASTSFQKPPSNSGMQSVQIQQRKEINRFELAVDGRRPANLRAYR